MLAFLKDRLSSSRVHPYDSYRLAAAAKFMRRQFTHLREKNLGVFLERCRLIKRRCGYA